MRIVVLVKQVIDPLLPISELAVSPDEEKILGPPNVPPVVNGYDEQAMEAAIRIKESPDTNECEVLALSVGDNFVLDAFQRSLAEADDLILIKHDSLDTSSTHLVARVLAAAIRHIGEVDLVLCGRQASDWDHGQVPLALAGFLGWPCMTLARDVRVGDTGVEVDRVLSDGYQVMECDLPAVVTVTSELGELRYPTIPMRLQARRRRPTHISLEGLEMDTIPDHDRQILALSLLEETRDCRFVEGDDDVDAGRRLAGALLEAGVITPDKPIGGA
jgi:electron transfer flavoprotein beta subunit